MAQCVPNIHFKTSLLANVNSTVEYACDTITNQRVVYKKLQDYDQAQHEINVLKSLKDVNNIAKLLYTFSESGSTVLVFPEYDQLCKRNLDLYDIRNYMKKFAKILVDIHSAGFAHLDVTPANVLSSNGDPVLIDFGLAERIGETLVAPRGTPGYIAPEVYKLYNVTSASDIYSFGVVCGQLLEIYLPGCSLQLLGSKLARDSTTNRICEELEYAVKNESWCDSQRLVADLLYRMLCSDASRRITAKEILSHPFFKLAASEFWEMSYCFMKPSLIPKRPSTGCLTLYRD